MPIFNNDNNMSIVRNNRIDDKSFNDKKDIISTFTNRELELFYRYNDKRTWDEDPKVIPEYRSVYYKKNNPIGYVELTKNKNEDSYGLAIGIKEDSRGTGLSKTMVRDAINYANENNLIIEWTAHEDNKASNRLAEEFLFTKYKYMDNRYFYKREPNVVDESSIINEINLSQHKKNLSMIYSIDKINSINIDVEVLKLKYIFIKFDSKESINYTKCNEFISAISFNQNINFYSSKGSKKNLSTSWKSAIKLINKDNEPYRFVYILKDNIDINNIPNKDNYAVLILHDGIGENIDSDSNKLDVYYYAKRVFPIRIKYDEDRANIIKYLEEDSKNISTDIITEALTKGKKFSFYHYVSKGIKLDPGLASPEYMYNNGMEDLFRNSTDKYRDRLVNGWGYYPNMNPDDLTDEQIFNGVNKFRKSDKGLSYIYFFRYPLPLGLGPKLDEFIRTHDCYEINLDNRKTKSLIEDIDWGYEGSNSDNKKLNEKWYRTVSKDEYFSKYDDNAVINFASMNHIAISFKNGYCPSSILTKVKSNINESTIITEAAKYKYMDNRYFYKRESDMLDENTIINEGLLAGTLYHGATKLYKTLEPRGSNFGNALQKAGWDLYTFRDYTYADAWGIFCAIREITKKKNIKLEFMHYTNNLYTNENGLEIVKDLISNNKLVYYVYHIQMKPEYEYGLGHSSNTPGCITIRNEHVRYKKVDKLVVTYDRLLKYLKVLPDDEFDDSKVAKYIGINSRASSILMNRDYMYNRKIRKQLQNLSYEDDLEEYIKDNDIEFYKPTLSERIKDRVSPYLPVKESKDYSSSKIIDKGVKLINSNKSLMEPNDDPKKEFKRLLDICKVMLQYLLKELNVPSKYKGNFYIHTYDNRPRTKKIFFDKCKALSMILFSESSEQGLYEEYEEGHEIFDIYDELHDDGVKILSQVLPSSYKVSGGTGDEGCYYIYWEYKGKPINESTIITEAAKDRLYKCPHCNKGFTRVNLVTHIEKEHHDFIPKDYTAARVVFNYINKKDHGVCTICGNESPWNETTWKYDRFCSKKCKEKYVEIMKSRMVNKYGKPHLLNDMEKQREMLSNRSISGTYKFKDGGKRTYCGSYERKLLEFFDQVMNVSSDDIMTPGPNIEYEYNEEKHQFILDLYYIPANLVIDVKDGGDNPNNRPMEGYREKQIAKEKAIAELNTYNYLRLTDNNFQQLLLTLAEIKEQLMDGTNNIIIDINENAAVMGAMPPLENPNPNFVIPVMKNNSFIGNYVAYDKSLYPLFKIKNGKLVKTKDKIEDDMTYEVYSYNGNVKDILSVLEYAHYDTIRFSENFKPVMDIYIESLLKSSIEKATLFNNIPGVKPKYSIPVLNEELISKYNKDGISIHESSMGYYLETDSGYRTPYYKEYIPEDIVEVLKSYTNKTNTIYEAKHTDLYKNLNNLHISINTRNRLNNSNLNNKGILEYCKQVILDRDSNIEFSNGLYTVENEFTKLVINKDMNTIIGIQDK